MLVFVTFRQLQVGFRRLPGFLDKSMEQNHAAPLVDIKKHPRGSVLDQAYPHFVDTAAQRPANWHPDGPAELYRLDVLPDPFPVLW
jgi:hypothetical protein